jgi:hypothetical protein
MNRGTVVANGATPVAVPFTDIAAAPQETVKLIATTADPRAWVSSVTPGTGFSITSGAGDAGTYAYEIT